MGNLTKDERTFLNRVAAELAKSNPSLKGEPTQEMITAAMESVLRRDRELVKAIDELPALRNVLTLQAYNAGRTEGLKEQHRREVSDERAAGDYRASRFIQELAS